MARYVIVQFDDNSEAERFVSAIETGVVLCSKGIADGEYAMQELQPGTVKIKGMNAKPTIFCDCKVPSPGVQSQKYNWTVCPACSKAKRGWHHPWNMLDPQKEDETRTNFVRRRMYYLGTVEGLEYNPEARNIPLYENPNYVPLRSMKR